MNSFVEYKCKRCKGKEFISDRRLVRKHLREEHMVKGGTLDGEGKSFLSRDMEKLNGNK